MTRPATDINSFKPSGSRRLWLFVLVYPLHIIEEFRGLGVPHGINLSLKQFLALGVAGCLMMVGGILLSIRFHFPQLLEVFFGTIVVLNALSHVINCIIVRGYDAGVITGVLIYSAGRAFANQVEAQDGLAQIHCGCCFRFGGPGDPNRAGLMKRFPRSSLR